jgi:hypothetical protein
MPKEYHKTEINDVIGKKETPKALLVEIEGEDFWIPKSVIDDDSEVHSEGDIGTLVVPEWFAEKEGLTG